MPPATSRNDDGVTACKSATLTSATWGTPPLSTATATSLPTASSSRSSITWKCVTMRPARDTSTSPGSSTPSDGPPGTTESTTSMPMDEDDDDEEEE